MVALEIENFIFELRKINAIKIGQQQEELKENTSEEMSNPVEIKAAFEQKQDKEKIKLYVSYSIPSIAEYDFEIDAEFNGLISLKEPFDLKKEYKDSPIVDEFIRKKILPKISKEVDRILFPIFKNMNVKYEQLIKKSDEEYIESKDNS